MNVSTASASKSNLVMNPLTLSERAKSVVPASAKLATSAASPEKQPAETKPSQKAILAENKRMQAKLWLSLYFLKKFGIKKLKMDPKIDGS